MALTDGVVAAYSFDNDAWADSSGNGHTGTATGAIFDASVKKVGTHSGFFDGSDDRVNLADTGSEIADLDSSDFTVVQWVNQKTQVGGNDNIFCFSANNGCGMIDLIAGEFGISKPGTSNGPRHTTALSADTWHLCIVGQRNSDGRVFYWVDNVKQDFAYVNFGNGGAPSFGRRGSTANKFNGNIDMPVIYNRLITDDEATEHWADGNGLDIYASSTTTPRSRAFPFILRR